MDEEVMRYLTLCGCKRHETYATYVELHTPAAVARERHLVAVV